MEEDDVVVLLASRLLRDNSAGVSADPTVVQLRDACTAILGADDGAVTLGSSTQGLTARPTDPGFAQIEELQMVLGEGPAPLAFSAGRTVSTRLDPHSGESCAFPMFAAMAGTIEPAVVIHAVPMRPGGHTIGVLTLYVRGGRLSRTSAEAESLADVTGTLLRNNPDARRALPRLTRPRWAHIHQATGAVVAQLGLVPADALAVLRAHALGRGSTLESVISEIRERRLSFVYEGGERGTGVIVARPQTGHEDQD